jgi:5-oxoprolinase (ATP-hydrolysing) subunit A
MATNMKSIDLNVDLGEGFPFDEGLMHFATSANVCCGEHAGSRLETERTIRLLESKGLRVGAHPGYPDRPSAGRAAMPPEAQRQYLDSIFRQLRWFSTLVKPAYLKPHGAFYHETAVLLPENWRRMAIPPRGVAGFDPESAYLARFPGLQSLAMLLRIYQTPLMGFPGTAHEIVAQRADKPFFREGFVDRRYDDSGQLVPRTQFNAILTEEAEIRAQLRDLVPRVDSLCLHGDTPDCLEIAAIVRDELTRMGVTISA